VAAAVVDYSETRREGMEEITTGILPHFPEGLTILNMIDVQLVVAEITTDINPIITGISAIATVAGEEGTRGKMSLGISRDSRLL